MKNVGILSMQRVRNYGSFLQAFALKTTVESLGYRCEFIDIEPGVVFPEFRRTYSLLFRKAVERYLKWDVITRIRYTKRFQARFDSEFFDLLGINKHTIERFDTVIIGSDEVFNFAQPVPWGFTPQLYGRVANADKVISYAGSFGHTTIESIEKYNLRQEIAGALGSMHSISVRDLNSFEIVKELTGQEPNLNVDPVLVFDYHPYVKPTEMKDYILIYSYPNRIKSKSEIAAIKSFAKRHNKKLISIGFYFSWCDMTVIPDPYEVLGYIKGADYIITDTFHGSVMSLKFNKKFAAIVRSTNRQKMTSLLAQFGLEGRMVGDISELESVIVADVDYNNVNGVLKAERTRSIEYLTEALK